MSKEIAFVVCSNGFGHFRRCLRVADWLRSNVTGVSFRFFCTERQLKHLADWRLLEDLRCRQQFRIEPVGANVEWKDIESGKTKEMLSWVNDFPGESILNSRVVVSDNLSGILSVRPDAVMMGSFLWSEVLDHRFSAPSAEVLRFIDRERKLLQKYRPHMICLEAMAMPGVLEHTQVVPTNWMVEPENIALSVERHEIQNILLAGGGTGLADQVMIAALPGLLHNFSGNIFVGARLYRQLLNPDERVKVFDFSNKSFHQVDLMICRPGIGALTDAVSFYIPTLILEEKGNLEMQYNGSQMQKLDFGKCIGTRPEAIVAALTSMKENGQYRSLYDSLRKAGRNGITEAGSFLKSHLN